jgi:hypothetical protein
MKGEQKMRFLMLMIPKVYQGTAGQNLSSDFAPTAEAVSAMMKFNEDLAASGALIALDGLHPPTTADRVSFPGGKARVLDGPYTEAKEVVGGFWILKANSREEAMDWAKRVPAEEGDIIEVRQIFEMEEFPEDVRKAADSSTVREAIAR